MPADRARERGSAAVEFALLLPILLLLLLALVQVGVIARDSLVLTQASRAGAREAAVQGSERCGRRGGPRGRRRSGSRIGSSVVATWSGARGAPVTVDVALRRAGRVAAGRVAAPRVRLAPSERDDASGVRVIADRSRTRLRGRSRARRRLGWRADRGSITRAERRGAGGPGRARDGCLGRRPGAPRGVAGADGRRRGGARRRAGARDRRGGPRTGRARGRVRRAERRRARDVCVRARDVRGDGHRPSAGGRPVPRRRGPNGAGRGRGPRSTCPLPEPRATADPPSSGAGCTMPRPWLPCDNGSRSGEAAATCSRRWTTRSPSAR